MATVSTTNVDIAEVKSVIGNSSNDLGTLCKSNTINKWSKKKPTSITGNPSDWYNGGDNFYGLNPSSGWSYLKPSGGSASPYRLGDFRGYEHDQSLTLPPSYVVKNNTSFNSTTVYDPKYLPDISGMLSLNTGQLSEITLTDMGLQGYFFGMYVRQAAHGIFRFKSLGVVATNGQWISGNIRMDAPYTTFYDFPNFVYGEDIDVSFILSSDIKSTWSSTAPSTYYILPHELVNGLDIKSSYIMSIGNFLIADTTDWGTFHRDVNQAVSQSAPITTNITAATYPDGWKLISKPSWLDISYSDNMDRIINPPLYDNAIVRADVNVTNSGALRHGTIILGDTEGNLESIVVSQAAGPINVYVYSSSFNLTAGTCIGLQGYTTVEIEFVPDLGINDYENVWWYITIGDYSYYSTVDEFFQIGKVGFDVTKTINIGTTLLGGEAVKVFLLTGGPMLPE